MLINLFILTSFASYIYWYEFSWFSLITFERIDNLSYISKFWLSAVDWKGKENLYILKVHSCVYIFDLFG